MFESRTNAFICTVCQNRDISTGHVMEISKDEDKDEEDDETQTNTLKSVSKSIQNDDAAEFDGDDKMETNSPSEDSTLLSVPPSQLVGQTLPDPIVQQDTVISKPEAERVSTPMKRLLSDTEDSEEGGDERRLEKRACTMPLTCSDNQETVIREERSIHTQTDVGGRDAFYSHANLKPIIILEEGVKAQDTYTSIHGSYILLAEVGCQTTSIGHSAYHKATQMPEMSYNPYTNKNVVVKRTPVDVVIKPEPEIKPEIKEEVMVELKPELLPIAMTTAAGVQTESAYTQLHKATQYPDKEYADPGHPPAPAPPIFWNEQQQQQQYQLQLQQQVALQQQQQQQQQLLLQQQLAMQQAQQQQQQQLQQYYYIDPTTGLPVITGQQQQQYLQFYPGYEQQ